MAELVATRAASIGVHASPEALDLLTVDGAVLLRPAPDEMMLLAPPEDASRVLEAASTIAGEDPTAVVLDETDGWSIWTLAGDDARVAFARISALSPPASGTTQGEVAHLPARVVAALGAIHVVVASMWSDAVRDLIVEACPEIAGATGTAPFDVKGVA